MELIAFIIAIIALVVVSRRTGELKQSIGLLEEDVATLIREVNALSTQKE